MARSRNLKPGFFKNELLADLSPLTRLFFQGIWCEADRRGILEDRPKRLKADILPYDDADPEQMLADLQSLGFIQRYEKDGTRCIFVVNFTRHQNPHRDEKASTLPTPCEHGANTVPSQGKTGTSTASTLRPDHLPPEGTPPVVPQPDAPKPEPPEKPDNPRSDRQKTADKLFEDRTVIFEAYCRGLGIDADSLSANQRRGPSFSALSRQVLDAPECDVGTIETLTRYTKSAFKWRNGRQTPSLKEVLDAFPEWDQQGRPDHVPRAPARNGSDRPVKNGRAGYTFEELVEMSKGDPGESTGDDQTVIDAQFDLAR